VLDWVLLPDPRERRAPARAEPYLKTAA
jgi:hypothetical protein